MLAVRDERRRPVMGHGFNEIGPRPGRCGGDRVGQNIVGCVRGATAPINLSGTPFLTGEFSIATRVSRGDVVHDGDVSRVRAGVAVAIHQPCHQ